ncbi:MAG: hypothetical protein HY286_00330 [Planctomycetes bacterium]|nr:hypothetical protein [Planctomycetota bacterium]
MTIDPQTIYTSVRQEILEQKKCQFQLVVAAITVTVGVLAFASSSYAIGPPSASGAGNGQIHPTIYIAPMLMDLFALMIILNKSKSIQRMVGYLQLMESNMPTLIWKWESHLEKFRAGGYRRHAYILNVSFILIVLSLLCLTLYLISPSADIARNSGDKSAVAFYWLGFSAALFINVIAMGTAFKNWLDLVYLSNSSKETFERWKVTTNINPTHN